MSVWWLCDVNSCVGVVDVIWATVSSAWRARASERGRVLGGAAKGAARDIVVQYEYRECVVIGPRCVMRESGGAGGAPDRGKK